MTKEEQDALLACYHEAGKHANYQVLAPDVAALLEGRAIQVKTRWEKERMACISQTLPLAGKRILDIGGNTGFFSFEALRLGAKSVRYVEGTPAHARFVQLAAQALHCGKKLEIENTYYDFAAHSPQRFDIVFLLNVLHHVGDDYGDPNVSKEKAKQTMLTQLNAMATQASWMVFQLGFNWKGNRLLPLFREGTKSEQIAFIRQGVTGCWHVQSVFVPVKHDGKVVYEPLDDTNIQRDDSLGEFLNRPLFFLQSGA